MAMRRSAARSGEWAQHFSDASCCQSEECLCTAVHFQMRYYSQNKIYIIRTTHLGYHVVYMTPPTCVVLPHNVAYNNIV